MSKHTPLTFENSGLVDCVFRGRERVAEMIGPESAKLGPLFAAAPELLEALLAILKVVEFAIERSDGDLFGIRHNDAMDAIGEAESAIAKATGE